MERWQDEIYRDMYINEKAVYNPIVNDWVTANYKHLCKKYNNIEHINRTYMYLTYNYIANEDIAVQFDRYYKRLERSITMWNNRNKYKQLEINALLNEMQTTQTEV